MVWVGMAFVAHLYAEIVAFLMMTGIMMGYAWAEKAGKPSEEYQCPVVIFFRAFLFICLVPLGLIFWDMIIKELVFGVLGYGNIMHAMGSIILMGIIGIEFIIAAAFVAPTRKALITFGIIVFLFVFFWEYYYPYATEAFDLEDSFVDVLLYCIVGGAVTQASLATIHGIYLKVTRNPTPRRDTPLWNIRPQFKKFYSGKMNFILWGLIALDFVLSFEGHGLLSWLTLGEFLVALVCIGGTLLVTKIVVAIWTNNKFLDDEWNQVHFSRTGKLDRKEEQITMVDGEILQGYIYRSSVGPGGSESTQSAPGPAILFLHGFGGYAQDIHFEPMLSSLAMGGYTVFAYDYRWSGHSKKKGQSGVFQGVMKEGISLFEHLFADAKVAFEWMLSHDDLVDFNRVGVAGFSMGGTIAIGTFIGDTRVKAIIAGCTMFDFSENIRNKIINGSILMKIVGLYLYMRIKLSTGMSLAEFLEKGSMLSPAHAIQTTLKRDPSAATKVLLAHCRDDSVVDFELNFVKLQEALKIPERNTIIFETGDHEFKHNETTLLGWILSRLKEMLSK